MQNVKDKDFKAPPNHIQCVLDGVTCFFWFGSPGQDDCVDFLKENHGNIFFYSNKILKTGGEPDTNWTNAYTDLAAVLKDFVTPKAETILVWTGTEESSGARAFYEAECKKAGGTPAAATAAPPKVEEKKQVPTPQQKPAGEKKVKQPIKEKVINRWTIENYTEA